MILYIWVVIVTIYLLLGVIDDFRKGKSNQEVVKKNEHK